MELELLLSIALGVGLAAACGFRIFVPFTVMSVAALGGYPVSYTHLTLPTNREV